MNSGHEAASADDVMPKARSTAGHAERAGGGGVAGQPAGVQQHPHQQGRGGLPYIRQLPHACRGYGGAVMIEPTQLGRRTGGRGKGVRLSSGFSYRRREPARRAFPKPAKDWDIERISGDFPGATGRMKDAGMDGTGLQVFGHRPGQFWSPLAHDPDGPYGGQTLDSRIKPLTDVLAGIRARPSSGHARGA